MQLGLNSKPAGVGDFQGIGAIRPINMIRLEAKGITESSS
jgi:hypothetical protein